MMQVGRDVTIPDLQRQKMKRVKKGECPECGTKLFSKPGTSALFGRMKKPVPINEPGKCLNGRCLICFPLKDDKNGGGGTTTTTAANSKIPVPRTIECRGASVTLNNTAKGNNNINIDGDNDDCNDDTGMGCYFGPEFFDDNVSEITLDRRIRFPELDNMNNNSNNKKQQQDQSHTNINTASAVHDSFSKILALCDDELDDDDLDESNSNIDGISIRKRMAELLKIDDSSAATALLKSVPAEEKDKLLQDQSNNNNDNNNEEAKKNPNNSSNVKNNSNNNIVLVDNKNNKNKEIVLAKWEAPSVAVEQEVPRKPSYNSTSGGAKAVTQAATTNDANNNADNNCDIEENIQSMLEVKFPKRKKEFRASFSVERTMQQTEIQKEQQQQQQKNGVPVSLSSNSDHNRRRRHSECVLEKPKKPFISTNLFVPQAIDEDKTQEIVIEEEPSPIEEDDDKNKDEDDDDDDVDEEDEFGAEELGEYLKEELNGNDIFFDSSNMIFAPMIERVKVKTAEEQQRNNNNPAEYSENNSLRNFAPEEFTSSSDQILLLEPSGVDDPDEVNIREVPMKQQQQQPTMEKKPQQGSMKENQGSSAKEIELGAVLVPPALEKEFSHNDDASLVSLDHRKRPSPKGSTVPTTAESSHVASDDGEMTPHGSCVVERLDMPVTPKKEEFSPIPQLRNRIKDSVDHFPTKPHTPLKKPSPPLSKSSSVSSSFVPMSPGKKPPPQSPKKPPPPSPKKAPPSTLSSSMSVKIPKQADMIPQPPLADMFVLLNRLQNGKSDDHERILSEIADRIWNGDGKEEFLEKDGISILSQTMWSDMMFPKAERAAVNLFLAVVATPSGNDNVVNHPDMEGLIDALLITMQTLIMEEELQEAACRVLCCLSSNSKNANDGTRSGACLAVLNAMDAHYSSDTVQEWGLRALYNQCVSSKHANDNKRTLVTCKLDTSGASGGEVLDRMILQHSTGPAFHLRGGILEWACKLCWCLTSSSEAIADMVSLHMSTVREFLRILEECRSVEDASPQLQEAVLGMIANLARNHRYKSFLGTPDVIMLVLDTMHGNKDSVGVQIEACNVIFNISAHLPPQAKDDLADAGIVRTIVGAIFAFPNEKDALHEPALRALAGVAVDSEITKEEICEQETLSVLMRSCRVDEKSTLQQQQWLCNVLASVFSSERLQMKSVNFDTLGALCAAASRYNASEKLQMAVCTAFRNVSKSEANLEALLQCGAVNFVVDAMDQFRMSRPIQGHGSVALWNIGAMSEFGHEEIALTRAVECLVFAVRTHLDTFEVVDDVCGALWGLMHRSKNLRNQFLDIESGFESVSCTLVMHPSAIPLLEKACGIMAIASSRGDSINPSLVAEGVLNMVDTIRNNPNNVNVLQYGTIFLRNTIMHHPRFVEEASSVLPVIVNALREFTRADPFLREACYFIWTISELSYEAKSRIIALDGVSAITAILDYKGGIKHVENAALGAFKELALESQS